jgi:predicted transcriptional regulator
MSSRKLAQLLSAIASQDRLAILEKVCQDRVRHTDLTHLIRRSGAETSRHLSRLVAAGLITRGPGRRWQPTVLAWSVRSHLPTLRFLAVHDGYLKAHDFGVVDPPLLARLGDLRGATFISGRALVREAFETALARAEHRAWILAPRSYNRLVTILRARGLGRLDVRIVRPSPVRPPGALGGRAGAFPVPVRCLARVDLFAAILDGQACLAFPDRTGRLDLSSVLVVSDPRGLRWAVDLFDRHWERAVDTAVAPRTRSPSADFPSFPVVGPEVSSVDATAPGDTAGALSFREPDTADGPMGVMGRRAT